MPGLEIETKSLGSPDCMLVKPKGRLDVHSFGDLKAHFETLIRARKDLKMVVDLSLADFIASSGWSVLLARRKMAKMGGGELVICGMQEGVRRVYDAMMIASLLPQAGDQEAALSLIRRDS